LCFFVKYEYENTDNGNGNLDENGDITMMMIMVTIPPDQIHNISNWKNNKQQQLLDVTERAIVDSG